MNDTLKWLLIIGSGVVAGVLILAVLAGLLYLLLAPRTAVDNGPILDRFASNGERIYLTGTNSQGERIPFTGGPRWLYMRGGGCADCHGPRGQGGQVVMMGTIEAPNIQYEHLIEEEHGEGEEHPPYTEDLIKRAITEGLDPAGRPLDRFMPRWQLSDQDLNDLVDYMKTLN
ncbi:MAG: cytochrome c [Anaerolineae bacterium]|nr:cytochrome c [Anaerolineae bacterium]